MAAMMPRPCYPLAAAPAASSLLFLLLRRRRATVPPPSLSTAPAARRRSRAGTPVAAAFSADDEDLFAAADDDEEDDAPWEGAVVYRRDASVHHLEYGTTLDRLGLGDLCSAESRASAAAMGILLEGGEEESRTPVLVSLDVTRRRGGRLRLDGILRTVITLGCFRCADPAPQAIFANFSLLLTAEPVEEPDVVDLGTIFEELDAAASASSSTSPLQDDDDDHDIDWDDRLHFPAGDKEIDISKHIRDAIHLEITLDAFCSPTCKGLCLVCGANLNTTTCSCGRDKPKQPNKDSKRPGPLKQLLKPMRQA